MITDLVAKVKESAANLPANPAVDDLLPLLDLIVKYGPIAAKFILKLVPGNAIIEELVTLGPTLLPMLQELVPILKELAVPAQTTGGGTATA